MKKILFFVFASGLFALLLSGTPSAESAQLSQCKQDCCVSNSGQWTANYGGVCSWPEVSPEVNSENSAFIACMKQCPESSAPSLCSLPFVLAALGIMAFFFRGGGSRISK